MLLDEIEKAHPDTFNVLLQILDDGHITDAKGRRVDFKNTIIIMTSNIGSDVILNAGKAAIGFSGNEDKDDVAKNEEIRDRVMDMMKERFRPEFLNRVDDTIMFHSLTEEHIAEIVELQLEIVSERLEEQRDITIDVTDEAKQLLAKRGFDPQYGARPLKRVIQKLILDPLSMQIVTGTFAEEDNIVADAQDDEITLSKVSEEEAVAA